MSNFRPTTHQVPRKCYLGTRGQVPRLMPPVPFPTTARSRRLRGSSIWAGQRSCPVSSFRITAAGRGVGLLERFTQAIYWFLCHQNKAGYETALLNPHAPPSRLQPSFLLLSSPSRVLPTRRRPARPRSARGSTSTVTSTDGGVITTSSPSNHSFSHDVGGTGSAWYGQLHQPLAPQPRDDQWASSPTFDDHRDYSRPLAASVESSQVENDDHSGDAQAI
ncbi:hypothetical protein FB45DRAFT_1080455 [Roridomyces roridus]|uniref:Uncharacterized protein n=1 Tax=Roridomyces roridus TaxID=1738132 RepID=A0AAD7BS02_9AGAR|nr:hypothetical protein FB45DRAFT_1080455 [Roridomyces roridus]